MRPLQRNNRIHRFLYPAACSGVDPYEGYGRIEVSDTPQYDTVVNEGPISAKSCVLLQ